MVVQPTVDMLDQPTVMKQIRKLAEGVDNNNTDIQNQINEINEAIQNIDQEEIASMKSAIQQNTSDIAQNTSDISANETNINKNTLDITELMGELPTDFELTLESGHVLNFRYDKENGEFIDASTGLSLPFIQTATLIPGATERSFKIQIVTYEGTITTNDFIIPEGGGGTSVSVSAITLSYVNNVLKASIQLDDGTTIDSNEITIESGNSYDAFVDASTDGTNTLKFTYGNGNTKSLSMYPVMGIISADALSSFPNEMTFGYYDTNTGSVQYKDLDIVKSVSGSVDSSSNLKISVNGVESDNIALPSEVGSGEWYVYTGTLADLKDENEIALKDVMFDANINGPNLPDPDIRYRCLIKADSVTFPTSSFKPSIVNKTIMAYKGTRVGSYFYFNFSIGDIDVSGQFINEDVKSLSAKSYSLQSSYVEFNDCTYNVFSGKLTRIYTNEVLQSNQYRIMVRD